MYMQQVFESLQQRPSIAKFEEKKCQLPWWFIYIGYSLALCVVGISFYMTVGVAGQFGPEKSKEWLFSFCVSVVESIFISQPIKVVKISRLLLFVKLEVSLQFCLDYRPGRSHRHFLCSHLEETGCGGRRSTQAPASQRRVATDAPQRERHGCQH